MVDVMQLELSHISATLTPLKSIYFAYFRSIMKYGIIFWGNSCKSRKILTLQKKIIRIIKKAQVTHSAPILAHCGRGGITLLFLNPWHWKGVSG
jgi:hypothetical protein